jgi:hypothetical protein
MDQGQMAKLLDELGATPDEVAARLKVQGIQGVRNAVRFLNPVVRYLAGRIRVDAFGLDVMKGDRVRLSYGEGTPKEEVLIPDAIRQFLDRFNRGQYPELELPPEKT